jgi:hypothetical protein
MVDLAVDDHYLTVLENFACIMLSDFDQEYIDFLFEYTNHLDALQSDD